MKMDYTNEELEALARERDEAEKAGLWDTIENPNGLSMTPEQELALAQAVSTLSDLAKETNSSMSDLLARWCAK